MTNRQRNNRTFTIILAAGVLAWLVLTGLSAIVSINLAALLRESMSNDVAGAIGMTTCLCLVCLWTSLAPRLAKPFIPQALPEEG